MTTRFAMLAAAGAILSIASLSAPASAQYYRGDSNYSDVTRCDNDGDRCATYRCDRYGNNCERVSGWYARPGVYNRTYNDDDQDGYYDRNDNDDDNADQGYNENDVIWRCDSSGNNCRRVQ